MDILCFSSSDWHGKWGSRQQVMMRFASRGHQVFFVEQLAGLEHFWKHPQLRRRRWQRWREGMRNVRPNLRIWAPPPLLPGRYYSIAIARVNAMFVCRWLEPHLRRSEITKPILWLYQPEHAPLVGCLGERLVVYHCTDEFTAGTQGHKHQTIADLETELLYRADVVFANSMLTYENKRQLNTSTYRIPSGANVGHFAQVLNPATLVHPSIASIPHPIAGYIGNINNKLDIHLLASVATYLSDWQFVFVGQAQHQSVDLHPLQELPNVHFLGRYPFTEMPNLVKGMDVCLLPYVDTEFAHYRSPLKLYEYLAAGKPIVSTVHSEAQEFSEWIEIASTSEEFATSIVRARDKDSREQQCRRAELAQQHSWDRRVDEMEQIIMAQLG
jgi:glycosyltransferase involved in cell wall biosynthesis